MCSGVSASGLSARLALSCFLCACARAAPALAASKCDWLRDAEFKCLLGILILDAFMATIAFALVLSKC